MLNEKIRSQFSWSISVLLVLWYYLPEVFLLHFVERAEDEYALYSGAVGQNWLRLITFLATLLAGVCWCAPSCSSDSAPIALFCSHQIPYPAIVISLWREKIDKIGLGFDQKVLTGKTCQLKNKIVHDVDEDLSFIKGSRFSVPDLEMK